MNIAYTSAPGKGDTDLLLFQLAQTMQARGYRLGGTVQVNTECEGNGPCDMDVRVLPDGPVFRISQSLGPNAKGCRLNPEALETAVGRVQMAMTEGLDALIVNKFGKHEADGRGFRPVIAEALERGLPVLVGLNRLNQEAFHAFSGNLAVELPPNPEALADWLGAAIAAGSEAA